MSAAQTIYNTAISAGLTPTFAAFMVGQSGNETNGWTSNFFVNNNNCFGYECDSDSDWQNGCSTGNADNGVTVGNYDSIEDSTMEVVDWWKRRAKDGRGGCPSDLSTITTVNQYTTILHNAGYFTSGADNYADRIRSFIAKLGGLFLTR